MNCLVKYVSGDNYVRIGCAGKTWIVHLAEGQAPPGLGEIVLLECEVDIVGENYRMTAVSWRNFPGTDDGREQRAASAPQRVRPSVRPRYDGYADYEPAYDSDYGEYCDDPFEHGIDEDEIPF